MGIFTPGEQRNTEYLKLKYSPSTPDTCTVHRTVNGVEHFAIGSAGFFVLLASFAVQRKEKFYTVKLKT